MTNLQVYTRLNHLNVTLSYSAVLKSVTDISKRHEAPIHQWIKSGSPFKFVGDNVDKKKGVRDLRSDNRSELKHMFSLLAVKGRVTPPPRPSHFVPVSLTSLPVSHFLPSESDVSAVRQNLIVLVSRVLCQYIKCLNSQKRSVVTHIPHVHSSEMATKSEVVVLDVLHKNETLHADMVDIMKEEQSYLGGKSDLTVISGGDQVTCERQRCSQQHMMDADTRSGRLELLEPCVEDWHCLLSVLGVGVKHKLNLQNSVHLYICFVTYTCKYCILLCTCYYYTILCMCVYYLDHMEVCIHRQLKGPWYLVASLLSAWSTSTSKGAKKRPSCMP